MTVQEKTDLKHFIDLARGYLNGGYIRTVTTDESSLPLAYLVEEEESPETFPVLALSPDLDSQELALFDRILASAGLSRDRNCLLINLESFEDPAYRQEFIRSHRPAIILCLGKDNARKIQAPDGIPVMAACHPREILENESLKRSVFEDMKLLMASLAGLDKNYALEAKDLLLKYASADTGFAARIQEYIF